MAAQQPGAEKRERQPGRPGRQGGQEKGTSELGGKEQHGQADEGKGVRRSTKYAAEESSEGGGSGLICQYLFVDLRFECYSADMAKLVCEQLVTLIEEPAGLVFKAASDDEQHKEVWKEVVGAAAEEQTAGGVDKETGGPVYIEAEEALGDLGGLLEKLWGDLVLLAYAEVFYLGSTLFLQSQIEFALIFL